MRALMTSQKMPKVSTVSGKVTILRSNHTVALMSPMTIGAISAAPTPRNWMPGKMYATIIRLAALISQCSSNPTMIL